MTTVEGMPARQRGRGRRGRGRPILSHHHPSCNLVRGDRDDGGGGHACPSQHGIGHLVCRTAALVDNMHAATYTASMCMLATGAPRSAPSPAF